MCTPQSMKVHLYVTASIMKCAEVLIVLVFGSPVDQKDTGQAWPLNLILCIMAGGGYGGIGIIMDIIIVLKSYPSLNNHILTLTRNIPHPLQDPSP